MGLKVGWLEFNVPFQYGEAWTVTKIPARRVDALDTRSLREMLRIPHTRHVTNATVGKTVPSSFVCY